MAVTGYCRRHGSDKCKYTPVQLEPAGFLITLFLLFVIVITPCVSGVELPEAKVIKGVAQV